MEQHSTQQQTYLDSIVDVLMQMHDETEYKRNSVNTDKIREKIEWCASDGFLYFDGKCLMMGRLCQTWFSDDLCANDIVIYTVKEHRGEGLAGKAIKEFVEWARSYGVKEGNVTIAQSSGINIGQFNSIAEGMNMKKVGAVYNV